MATERIAPHLIWWQTNYSGTIADIDEDPTSPDANWVTADDGVSATQFQASMLDPSDTPSTGADLQTFRAYVRRSNIASGTPSFKFELWEETGGLLDISSSINVTSTTGQLETWTWDASSLATADGSAVTCKIQVTLDSGENIDIGALDWVATIPSAGISLTLGTIADDTALYGPTLTVGAPSGAPAIARTSLPSGDHKYVSPSGDNANNGDTEGTPYETIQYALDNAGADGAVLLMPGTYRGGSYAPAAEGQHIRHVVSDDAATAEGIVYLKGSVVIDESEWTLFSGTAGVDAVYWASYTKESYDPTAIFVDDVPLPAQESTSLGAGEAYTDTAALRIYIRLADSDAPANVDETIERPYWSEFSAAASTYSDIVWEGYEIGIAATNKIVISHYNYSIFERYNALANRWKTRLLELTYSVCRLDGPGAESAYNIHAGCEDFEAEHVLIRYHQSDREPIHIGSDVAHPQRTSFKWVWVADLDPTYSGLEAVGGTSYRILAVINRGQYSVLKAITVARSVQGISVVEGEDTGSEDASTPHGASCTHCVILDTTTTTNSLSAGSSYAVSIGVEIKHCLVANYNNEGLFLDDGTGAGFNGLEVRDIVLHGDGGNPFKFCFGGPDGTWVNCTISGVKVIEGGSNIEWYRSTSSGFLTTAFRVNSPNAGATWLSAGESPTGSYTETTLGDGTVETEQTPNLQDTDAVEDIVLIPSGGIMDSKTSAVDLTLTLKVPSALNGWSYIIRVGTSDPTAGSPPDMSALSNESNWQDEVHVAAPYWTGSRSGTASTGDNAEVFTYAGDGTEVPGWAQAIVYDDVTDDEYYTSLPIPVLLPFSSYEGGEQVVTLGAIADDTDIWGPTLTGGEEEDGPGDYAPREDARRDQRDMRRRRDDYRSY